MKRFAYVLISSFLFSSAHAAVLRIDSVQASSAFVGKYESAAISPDFSTAFFVSSTSLFGFNGEFKRIDIATFVSTDSTHSSLAPSIGFVAVDSSGLFYLASMGNPATLSKFSSSGVFQSSVTFATGANGVRSGVIDNTNGYGYFGTNTSPGQIVKVKLSDLSVAATVTLSSGSNFLTTAQIDDTHGYAYFGSSTTTGIITKIKLSNFTIDSSLTLNSGDGALLSSFIDTDLGYVYFGTGDSPGKIVRIRLSDFTRHDSLTLDSGENRLTSAVYDPSSRYAYLGTDTSTGVVVRVKISNMVRKDALTLNAGEDRLRAVVIDTTNSYAYFGTYTTPGIVVKLDLIGGLPEINTQPSSADVPTGSGAGFSISATGRAITYQWNRDGTAISGATSANYTLPVVTVNDDGSVFTCVVSNSSGSVTSSPATLTVQPDIHAYPNPWRSDRHAGASMTFSGLPTGSQIRLFTLAAQWVRTVPENGGLALWDLKNDAGQPVASGYYFFYLQTSNTRQKYKGKIAVIR